MSRQYQHLWSTRSPRTSLCPKAPQSYCSPEVWEGRISPFMDPSAKPRLNTRSWEHAHIHTHPDFAKAQPWVCHFLQTEFFLPSPAPSPFTSPASLIETYRTHSPQSLAQWAFVDSHGRHLGKTKRHAQAASHPGHLTGLMVKWTKSQNKRTFGYTKHKMHLTEALCRVAGEVISVSAWTPKLQIPGTKLKIGLPW